MNRPAERPRPPQEPDAAECCGEGCVRCVFDVYEAKMVRYRADLERWLEGRSDGGGIIPPEDTSTSNG